MYKYLLIPLFLFFTVSASEAQEHDAEVKRYLTEIILDNGTLVINSYVTLQINSREGDRYASIQIPYSGNSNLSNVEATLSDENGVMIRRLKKADITDRSAFNDFSFYEDNYIKEFTIRHNQYPYIVKYSYRYTINQYLFITDWDPVIDPRIPTREALLNVKLPTSTEFSIKERGVALAETEENAGILSLTWRAAYNDIIEAEPFSPPTDSDIPSVEIIPDNFIFELPGNQSNWVNFGNWHSSILETRDDLPPGEKTKAVILTANASDPREKIRLLYHYLQDNTRYINISLETGGLVPYPASYVAQHKYGDCKALSNYFKCLLSAVGIESFYTKVNAGDNIFRIDSSSAGQQFNHIILFIPLEKDTLWLDCTSKGPFGYISTFIQGREALVVERNKSRILSIPKLTPDDVTVTRKIEITGSEAGICNARLKNVYMGDSFEVLRDITRNYNSIQQDNIVRDYIMPGRFELVDYRIIPGDRDDLSITMEAEIRIPDLYKKFGNDIIAYNLAMGIPNLKSPEKRRSPVQIDFPVHYIDSISYFIPEGCSLAVETRAAEKNSDFGQFRVEIQLVNDRVFIIRKFILHSGVYPSSRYSELYNFLKDVKELDASSSLVFNKKIR